MKRLIISNMPATILGDIVPSPENESLPDVKPGKLSCGVVDKFLSNFEDLIEVYLLGIHLVMK